MPRATTQTSLHLGLTTSRARSVGVAVAISTVTASGLNVPNARGRAALLAPNAGALGNAFKTVTCNQRTAPPSKDKWVKPGRVTIAGPADSKTQPPAPAEHGRRVARTRLVTLTFSVCAPDRASISSCASTCQCWHSAHEPAKLRKVRAAQVAEREPLTRCDSRSFTPEAGF
jgi:hypothetical protein